MSVKLLISQNPYIPRIFFPGIKGSTSPPFFILLAIISEPASPKPKANKAPSLTIKFSRIAVSSLESSLFYFIIFSIALLPTLSSSCNFLNFSFQAV